MPKKTQKLVENKNIKEVIIKEEKTFREKISQFPTGTHPNNIYEKGETIFKKVKETQVVTAEDRTELSDIALSINTTIHHRLLVEVMREARDRTAIIEFADDLIKEYGCNSISERALCEVVALAYFSIMKVSRELTRLYDFEYLSHERSTFYSAVSKELEKQNRMYLNSLQTLRTLKSPFGGISIKTNNAFIGDNQHFNNNHILSGENH